MNKNENRLRRAKSTRCHIRKLAVARLSVHRTGQHIYAQVFDASGTNVVAAASTVPRQWARRLPSVPWQRASNRLRLTVRASASTVASRRWPMPRVRQA
jgi:ribosomal protein L18